MGSDLKETREKLGYTVQEVAEALKIRKQYIISLEEGSTEDIPGQVYVAGYTKMYHEFLGIPYKDKSKKNAIVKPTKFSRIKNKINNANNSNISVRCIILSSILILAAVVALYAFLILPPANLIEENLESDTDIEQDIKQDIQKEQDIYIDNYNADNKTTIDWYNT